MYIFVLEASHDLSYYCFTIMFKSNLFSACLTHTVRCFFFFYTIYAIIQNSTLTYQGLCNCSFVHIFTHNDASRNLCFIVKHKISVTSALLWLRLGKKTEQNIGAFGFSLRARPSYLVAVNDAWFQTRRKPG